MRRQAWASLLTFSFLGFIGIACHMFARKHRFRVFGFFMSAILAFLMTGVVTCINTGLDAGFLLRWGRAFVIAWPIALFVVLLLGPPIRNIADRLCNLDG